MSSTELKSYLMKKLNQELDKILTNLENSYYPDWFTDNKYKEEYLINYKNIKSIITKLFNYLKSHNYNDIDSIIDNTSHYLIRTTNYLNPIKEEVSEFISSIINLDSKTLAQSLILDLERSKHYSTLHKFKEILEEFKKLLESLILELIVKKNSKQIPNTPPL